MKPIEACERNRATSLLANVQLYLSLLSLFSRVFRKSIIIVLPCPRQVDLYRETTLTQAGLEEYTRVQHSQQASYAQSEGYHSYVSSVDSTTNTPFLDR